MLATFPLAALIVVTSLGGILSPTIYAHETLNWTAQALGQDWFDLLVATPFLILTAWRAARGGRRASLLLAGGLGYALYEFLIYAFALHFNGLFLVYCAGLGTSFFALAGLVRRLNEQNVAQWYLPEAPVLGPGLLLCGVGIVFAALWLAEIIPAIAHQRLPPSAIEAGLRTNPVHVIDLSVVLPVHLLAGVALMRRRPAGFWLGPAVLAFGALMVASIAALMVMMGRRGFPISVGPLGIMIAMALLNAGATAALLRRVCP